MLYQIRRTMLITRASTKPTTAMAIRVRTPKVTASTTASSTLQMKSRKNHWKTLANLAAVGHGNRHGAAESSEASILCHHRQRQSRSQITMAMARAAMSMCLMDLVSAAWRALAVMLRRLAMQLAPQNHRRCI